MYLIYMSLCICCTIIVYFFVPETKQIPLEEIGALFGDEVVVHLTADGHHIVEKRLELPEAHIEHEDLGAESGKGPKDSPSVLHTEMAGRRED